MTDPYATGETGAAPLNQPTPAPAFDPDTHYPNQQAARFDGEDPPPDPFPTDPDTLEQTAAVLLAIANWIRRYGRA